MRDSTNQMKAVLALAPVVITDNTVQTGLIIDRLGFDSLTFVIATGVLADADATFAVTMVHGNDPALADGAAPDILEMIGSTTAASFDFSADNATRKIGYVGGKRYVRLVITPANNTGASPLAALCLLENASVQPQP